jgi:hypothetical protein
LLHFFNIYKFPGDIFLGAVVAFIGFGVWVRLKGERAHRAAIQQPDDPDTAVARHAQPHVQTTAPNVSDTARSERPATAEHQRVLPTMSQSSRQTSKPTNSRPPAMRREFGHRG